MSLVNFKKGTLANYKGLQTKDVNTLYFITDNGLLYLGNKLIAATSIAQKVENSTTVDGVYTITYIDSTNNTPQTIDVATTTKINNLIAAEIAKLDVASVTVATTDSNGKVVLTKAVKEEDGKISAIGGEGSTITLGNAANKDVLPGNISTTDTVSSTDLVSAAQVATYVESKMTGVVGAMVYQGTIKKSGNALVVDGGTQPTTAEKGHVYVAKEDFSLENATDLIISGKTIQAGNYEAGDMFIYNGNAWNVVNGENQVDNKAATVIPGASNSTTIATVDGTNITVKVAGIVSGGDGTSGNVVTGVSASGNGITVTKGNVIASVTGETAISDGNGNYVAVAASTSENAVTLSSTVKTQTVASAALDADGLATAYDIKTNVADNAVLTGYASASTGTISAASTITGAIKSLETAITWGEIPTAQAQQ